MDNETCKEIAEFCGDDPIKWAEAWNEESPDPVTEFEMIGWFTMAIEESNRLRSERELDFAEKLALDYEDGSDIKSIVMETKNPTRPSDLDTLRDHLNKRLPWSFKEYKGLLHFKEGIYWVGVSKKDTGIELDDNWIMIESLPKSWNGHSVIYYDKSAKGCPCCGFPECGHEHNNVKPISSFKDCSICQGITKLEDGRCCACWASFKP